MASEIKTENVMLTGQTAYFKKSGSMVNRGTLDLPDANIARSYAEGYIGPNSVLRGTDLATTSEYLSTENAMKDYLQEDWEEDENERTIITNATNIATRLLPGETAMQNIVDDMGLLYRVLPYIRGTGTQYIDTGIIVNSNLSVEVVAKLDAKNLQDYFVGAEDYNQINRYGFRSYSDRSVYFYVASGTFPNTYVDVSEQHTYFGDKNKLYIDGALRITTNSTVFTGNHTLYLFGNNLNGTASDIAHGNFYSCKIWNDGVLVRDLIPVIRISDEVVCMYDKVDKIFIENSGSGVFIAGS